MLAPSETINPQLEIMFLGQGLKGSVNGSVNLLTDVQACGEYRASDTGEILTKLTGVSTESARIDLVRRQLVGVTNQPAFDLHVFRL